MTKMEHIGAIPYEMRGDFQEFIKGKTVHYAILIDEGGKISLSAIVFTNGQMLKVGKNGEVQAGDIWTPLTEAERLAYIEADLPPPTEPLSGKGIISKGVVVYPFEGE